MDAELLTLLRSVDTPTVCNAIEVAQGSRGFADFTRGTVHCSAPLAPPLVGYAVTAKIAGRAPPTDPPKAVRALRMDYYRSVADAPKPAVVVIEDTDYPACVGAFWGEINAVVHQRFGLAGVLTDGVMRDLGDIPADFPIVAGSVGPSHGFVHITEIGTPVTVFGLTVAPGALVHADRHGAVVVPPDVVPVLAGAVAKLHATERIVLDAARAPDFDFAAFEKAWAAFEASRT